MEWEKLSTNRWRCKYHLRAKSSIRSITCDIYRRGKKKHCTWEIWGTIAGNKIWHGKEPTVLRAKDAVSTVILEYKLLR